MCLACGKQSEVLGKVWLGFKSVQSRVGSRDQPATPAMAKLGTLHISGPHIQQPGNGARRLAPSTVPWPSCLPQPFSGPGAVVAFRSLSTGWAHHLQSQAGLWWDHNSLPGSRDLAGPGISCCGSVAHSVHVQPPGICAKWSGHHSHPHGMTGTAHSGRKLNDGQNGTLAKWLREKVSR